MTNTRNILAAFRTIETAQEAAEALKENGFNEIQVDQISMFPGNHLNDLTNPITGDFESLSELTLGSYTNKNAEILSAADPSASGMADKNNMETNYNFLVTVVTNEKNAPLSENIIKRYDGLY